MTKKLPIDDSSSGPTADPVAAHAKAMKDAPPLPEEYGKNLDTIEKAKTWLLHPQNWIESRLWIIKWNGLVPLISRYHAERLIREPWDTGMYEVVVRYQYQLKHKAKRGESIAEVEPTVEE